jgi:hypothetical protein
LRVILAICISTLVAGTLVVWNAMRWPDQFGTFTGIEHTEIAALVDTPKDFIGKTVAVQGTVREQCKTMGCFFYLQAGKKTLRVDLEEIAMKAPRKEGHSAHVEGRIGPYGDGFQLFATAVRFE